MDPKIVQIDCSWKKDSTKGSDTDTWLSILEQTLALNCSNYKVYTLHDQWNQVTKISVEFENLEDAVWFRMITSR